MQLLLSLSNNLYERNHDLELANHLNKLGVSITLDPNAGFDFALRRSNNGFKFKKEITFSNSDDDLCDVHLGWGVPVLKRPKISPILSCDCLYVGDWHQASIVPMSAVTNKRFCVYGPESMRGINNFCGILPDCFPILPNAVSSARTVLHSSHPSVLSLAALYEVPIVGGANRLIQEKGIWGKTLFDSAKRLLLASNNPTAELFAQLCSYEKEECRANWLIS